MRVVFVVSLLVALVAAAPKPVAEDISDRELCVSVDCALLLCLFVYNSRRTFTNN